MKAFLSVLGLIGTTAGIGLYFTGLLSDAPTVRTVLSGGMFTLLGGMACYYAFLYEFRWADATKAPPPAKHQVLARPRAVEMEPTGVNTSHRAAQRLLIGAFLGTDMPTRVVVTLPNGVDAEPVGPYAWKKSGTRWEIDVRQSSFSDLGEFILSTASAPPGTDVVEVRLERTSDSSVLDHEDVRVYAPPP